MRLTNVLIIIVVAFAAWNWPRVRIVNSDYKTNFFESRSHFYVLFKLVWFGLVWYGTANEVNLNDSIRFNLKLCTCAGKARRKKRWSMYSI